MTEPEVAFARYLALAALAVLLISRALMAMVRRARLRAAAPRRSDGYFAQPAHPEQVADVVVDVVVDTGDAKRARAAPRRTHQEEAPPTDRPASDLRAAIVTREILGPPRGLNP